MKPDGFEQKLSRQSLRPIPAEWRAEIFREGRRAAVPEIGDADTASLPKSNWLTKILWPSPAAWAGLAAIWIFIFILNFSTRDKSPAVAEKMSPSSPEVLVELKQQQRLLAELMGPTAMSDADRPKFVR